VELTPQSGLVKWQSGLDTTSITPMADGSWVIRTQLADGSAAAVSVFALPQKDITATGASVRVKAPSRLKYQLRFVDADDTAVTISSHTASPDAEGWRAFSADFTQLPNTGSGNFVMETLRSISLCLLPPLPVDTPLEFTIENLTLAVGEPVRTLNASAGDAALQPRPQLTDETGALWVPFQVRAELDATMVREGDTSIRLSAEIDPADPAKGGGHVAVGAPAFHPWTGDRLVFWCLPQAAFLPVTVNGSNGVQLVKVLDENDLKVGEWNRVEIALGQMTQTDSVTANTLDQIGTVMFMLYAAWDPGRTHLRDAGEYVWYIDDLHFEGTGPVSLAKPVEPIPDVGLEAKWSTYGQCMLSPETETVASGQGALRMDVEFGERADTGGGARAFPPDGRAWSGTEVSFACMATNVPLLLVSASDSDGTLVTWSLDAHDLQPGEWRTIRLSPENQANLGSGDDVMHDIASLHFQCMVWSDPYAQVIPRGGRTTFYLDDLRITGTEPTPVRRFQGRDQGQDRVKDDTGEQCEWWPNPRAIVERELVVVREGAASARLESLPEGGGAHGPSMVGVKLAAPRPAMGVRFWVRPEEVAPLVVAAINGSQRSADDQTIGRVAEWTVAADQLAAGEWNRVVLRLADARMSEHATEAPHLTPTNFGPIDAVRFDLSAGAESATERRVWYIDSLQLIAEE
jgi:hypothetical protein